MVKDLEALSPFELSLYLEKNMDKTKATHDLLNAGRGNPNWTAPIPREAFFLLGQFATRETMQNNKYLTGNMINKHNFVGEKFVGFLQDNPCDGSTFLQAIWDEGEDYLGMPKEEWLTEMMDYIIGDNYPNPERCLAAVEKPIKQYLHHELFQSRSAPFDLFAVEGGTAGIVYTFDSLVNNQLLNQGDKIVLMIPTFAPYLEIPQLPHYGFDVEYIKSEPVRIEGKISYQFPQKEINRLRNPEIKAVFVVNPSNPTSNAISDTTIGLLKDVIEKDNPHLMILTDDVYGTFLEEFTSLFTEIPYNTACIYSYSKYFGATGWRVGTITIAKENLFDELLAQHSEKTKKELAHRYESLTSQPEEVAFIDRMVADSRDVALNHASGLSSPQQVMMTLFSLYSLLDKKDQYKKEVMEICHEREKILFDTLQMEQPFESLDTAYYCEIDFANWLENRYGISFSHYITKVWTMTQIITRFAETQQLMLLRADAFGSSKWSVRISLANLPTNQYKEVGKRIIDLSDQLHDDWLEKEATPEEINFSSRLPLALE
ncbi:aspartate 4-decarboxylase [Lacticigenium naphthae]|uniref:aspartate 4-decarboxylase n=1 Tax=Lacticigenium naphthae TaxID=515351 RepID=UPI00041381C2|nr:aspartate 4-decarboxylase [Lacticigenium naphthae]